jgi:hypothetical protein
MPSAKPLSKESIASAMDKTKSVRGAARYLNCSYQHLKKWMKLYKDEASGKTLFELHKNQSGKGVPKFLSHAPFGRKEPAILDIINGVVDPSNFNPQKIKYRMIEGGYLKEECYKCGFNERRVLDYKIPLLMHFKNGNKQNYTLENVEMLCYNCYYLSVGDLYTGKQIENIEDHKPINNGQVDWEVDDYTLERFKELGLYDSKPLDNDDPYDLVSRL